MLRYIRNFRVIVAARIKEALEKLRRVKLEASDGEITIKERYRLKPSSYTVNVPLIVFDIINNKKIVIGKIEYRDGFNDDIYLLGNVGYHINERYRGNNSAYKACKLLFEIIKIEFLKEEVFITCSPDNIASYKTLTKLNGEFVELKQVPNDHFLRRMNENEKCIFKYYL